MAVSDLFARSRPRLAIVLAILGCALIGALVWVMGRSSPSESQPTAPVLLVHASGSQWQSLTPEQQQILQPLAAGWDSLNSAQKDKWIALTHVYSKRTPAEQQKIQSRMVGWAALTPIQRERARLNFAETKKVSRSARAAEWEAYQNLSSEEKLKLASKGKAKPTGAAIAVKPFASGKLTPVPITRHTSPNDTVAAAVKPRIDPNTLLPLPPLPPVVIPASAPASDVLSPSVPAVNADTISPN
ncbi:MAG: DUF3106 domain-containing protein [Rhodoferax sp.]